MARFLLRLSYHGGPFRGFAANNDVRTVAGELDSALTQILQHRVVITCAGRTDAGVHALDQAVTFDTPNVISPNSLRASINGLCKPHIIVHAAARVDDRFDARHSCTGRSYLYRVLNRRIADPFRDELTWRVHGQLDLDAMHTAGAVLIGRHDFSSFCRAQYVVRPEGRMLKPRVRDLRSIHWDRVGDEVQLSIEASSFCQQMVRSIVGLSVDVGLGRIATTDVAGLLAAQDRRVIPRVAPPQGLFLRRVDYPGDTTMVDSVGFDDLDDG